MESYTEIRDEICKELRRYARKNQLVMLQYSATGLQTAMKFKLAAYPTSNELRTVETPKKIQELTLAHRDLAIRKGARPWFSLSVQTAVGIVRGGYVSKLAIDCDARPRGFKADFADLQLELAMYPEAYAARNPAWLFKDD